MKLNVTCCHDLCRLNVCGNTLLVMKSTEKVPSLCLRLMGKRTRLALDVNVLIFCGCMNTKSFGFVCCFVAWTVFPLISNSKLLMSLFDKHMTFIHPPPPPNRSIARTSVCWPSCFWTIKHCTMMWSLSCLCHD